MRPHDIMVSGDLFIVRGSKVDVVGGFSSGFCDVSDNVTKGHPTRDRLWTQMETRL